MEIRMDGRNALITGGSKGLGYAMADRFLEAGATVAIVARGQADLDRAVAALQARHTGTTVKGYQGDVSRADEISRIWQAVTAEFEQIDILVNNAGHAKVGEFESITDEEWQADIDLKLMAAVRLTRLAFPGMKARQWGRVLNMLNIYAKTPSAGTAPTSVTRAAGMALTKVLAGEGAPHNVLVNALNIGSIKSDQVRRWYDASDKSLDFEAFVARSGSRLPMGRMGEAEECANLACFLCSEAGSYVTGTSINMDGGASPVL
ncbi:MAG: SDR family oxidoreductase [Pseudomonadales bacterium]|nr:SDR family oxidoreductase [Pseudomonadales bacterium]